MSRRNFQDYLSESLANSPELRQAYEEAQAEDESIMPSSEQPPMAGTGVSGHNGDDEMRAKLEAKAVELGIPGNTTLAAYILRLEKRIADMEPYVYGG